MGAAWDWPLKRPVRGVLGIVGTGSVTGQRPFLVLEFGSLGAVAQLGERCVRNAEVEGSTPFRSTGSVYWRLSLAGARTSLAEVYWAARLGYRQDLARRRLTTPLAA